MIAIYARLGQDATQDPSGDSKGAESPAGQRVVWRGAPMDRRRVWGKH